MKTYLLSAAAAIFLSVIISLLVPEGKLNKTITFIMRLVCILVLIQPITGLFKLSQQWPTDSTVDYVFVESVYSDHQSAQLEKLIKTEFEKRCKNYDYLVVEGAGGITCPFNMATEQLLLPEVIKELGTDVLLVADGGLGTINSVLLTAEYAKSRGLNIPGIILNNYDKTDFMHLDNKKQVEVLTGINVIATVAKNDKNIDITKENLIKLFTPKEG